MHNWLEGIFQHYTWLKWDIGISSEADAVEHMTDHDMVIDLARGDSKDEILDKEILELQKESQIHNDIPLNIKTLDLTVEYMFQLEVYI